MVRSFDPRRESPVATEVYESFCAKVGLEQQRQVLSSGSISVREVQILSETKQEPEGC